jgi:hypothetical protein
MAHPELELVEKALNRPQHSALQGIYPSTEKIASTFGAKGFFKIITNLILPKKLKNPTIFGGVFHYL